jgi:c-di-GMP-binding flagellar brake protein YcgR
MSAEHRRQTRVELRVSAEIKVGTRTLTGVTRNLSTGGVCLELDTGLAEGDSIALRLFPVEDDIEAEGARGLEIAGRVQWVAEADRGYTVGVQFKDLSPAQMNGLVATVKRLGG